MKALALLVLGLLAFDPIGLGSSAVAQDPPAAGGKDSPPAPNAPPAPKPAPFATRKLTGKPSGGATQTTEKGILDGLRWFVRHQDEGGSWSALGVAARCRSNPPCDARATDASSAGDVGATSLVIACFLGAGFHQASRQDIVDTVMGKRHRIGTVISSGLTWLVQQQGEDGSWPASTCGLENQSLATLALSEVVGLTGDPAFQAPAQKGVDALQRAQLMNPSGTGRWGWSPCATASGAPAAEPADLTATLWAVQALRAARLSGLTVDDQALAGAVAFSDHLWKSTNKPKSAVQHATSLALLRLLARPLASDPVLRRTTDQLLESVSANGSDARTLDATTAFEEAFFMSQVHGPESSIRNAEVWKRWTVAGPAANLATQDQTERSCRKGGWVKPDPSLAAAGPTVATALRVLALENFYRYESAFGKPK